MKRFMGMLLTLLSFSILIAEARLGETEAECKARYGKPTEEKERPPPMTKALFFETNGIHIIANFVSNKCVLIGFWTSDRKVKFTDDVVATLLAANAGPSEWKTAYIPSQDRFPGQEFYERKDGLANARLVVARPSSDYSTFSLSIGFVPYMRISDYLSKKEPHDKSVTESMKGF